ncbi:hypothetical protein EU545_01315 [Candidatus Thorarchaeota archaeon]|nr:MAG: hypothetical protein EU545_01315 [Candidatus Thorarchaeota archaeon]
MYRVVVIGNPAYRKDTHEAGEGSQRIPSSPAINTSHVVSSLGVEESAIVGCCSSSTKQQLLADLDMCGIRESHLIDCTETSSFRIAIPEGNNRSGELVGVGDRIPIRSIPEEFLRADCIILSPVLQEVDVELVDWLVSSSDAEILWNPQLNLARSHRGVVANADPRAIRHILGLVDLIIPNRFEALLMTDCDDPFVAAETLVEWGVPLAVVTLDSDGSIVYDGKDFYLVPAHRAKAIETYGAGDAYMAAFAVKMLEGASWSKCGAFGAAAASLMIERVGCASQVSYSNVTNRSKTVYSGISIR